MILKEKFDSKYEFINYVKSSNFQTKKNSKKVNYYNIPCTIDIESSSFELNGEKQACMYCFTLGINGHSYFGRTYEELFEMLNMIHVALDTVTGICHLLIYIHNLAYEFQFFRKWFKWEKVFSISEREPLYALTKDTGLEFRCSYQLSGYSLSKVGEHLIKYQIKKRVGDLDYDLIRHSKTIMTEKEKDYVLYDGLVVMSYIQEQIESHHNNITLLPLTKTGEVRKYVRKNCLYGDKKNNPTQYINYHRFMLGCSIQSVEEYRSLKRAFMGGFTHANSFYADKIIHNVHSFDFTSSYPFVMCSEKFPYGKGEIVKINSQDELMKNLKLYCCIFDITFFDLESSIEFEHYISFSKCKVEGKYSLDNGRIISGDIVKTTITEIDFEIISKCYSWSKIKIKRFRRYKRDYLPKEYILSILELYKRKTTLKDVKGQETEYLNSKELLNSCYGMTVTDICRPTINYESDTWDTHFLTDDEYVSMIEKYNKQKNRFISYNWGIWTTAYARKNLWSGIFEFKFDYIYSDTDSVKVININNHLSYIEEYNKECIRKLKKMMSYHGLMSRYDELIEPQTIEGKKKILGLWDYEGEYSLFKTLGAKRYMVYKDNKLSFTISGVNKKKGIPYLLEKFDNDIIKIFNYFTLDMKIPSYYINKKGERDTATGKNVHTYLDEEQEGDIIDYLGNKGHYHELSSIHMSKADYTLSMSEDYLSLILGYKIKEIK